jgi:hypothetical protein
MCPRGRWTAPRPGTPSTAWRAWWSRLLLVEPKRDLVRGHHPTVDPPRHLLQRPRPGQAGPRLHQLLDGSAKPFTWTATAGKILAKVRLVQTAVRKLVNNNSNLHKPDHETLRCV